MAVLISYHRRASLFGITLLTVLITTFVYEMQGLYQSSRQARLFELLSKAETPVQEDSYTREDGRKVAKVILVTYHRGGSTFLGELFNQNPSAFYWFEPLNYQHHALARKYNIDMEQIFFNNNGTMTMLPEEIYDAFVSTLVNIFNCNFIAVDHNIMTHPFLTQWKKENKALPYIKCLEDNHFKQKTNKSDVIAKCVHWATEACMTSTVRAIKTIRMPAYMIDRLLRKDPTIHVIYYTRDIRAMLVSRAAFKVVNLNSPDDVRVSARKHCAWIRHDVQGFTRIAKSQQVLALRYEDFARQPFRVSEQVYKFLGQPLPAIVRRWLQDNTNARSDNGLLGTTRNSSATVDRWKDGLPRKAHETIVEQCLDVLTQQGYHIR